MISTFKRWKTLNIWGEIIKLMLVGDINVIYLYLNVDVYKDEEWAWLNIAEKLVLSFQPIEHALSLSIKQNSFISKEIFKEGWGVNQPNSAA